MVKGEAGNQSGPLGKKQVRSGTIRATCNRKTVPSHQWKASSRSPGRDLAVFPDNTGARDSVLLSLLSPTKADTNLGLSPARDSCRVTRWTQGH